MSVAKRIGPTIKAGIDGTGAVPEETKFWREEWRRGFRCGGIDLREADRPAMAGMVKAIIAITLSSSTLIHADRATMLPTKVTTAGATLCGGLKRG